LIEELVNSGISRELIVVIVSALPIFELRGALPLAINLFHIPWYWALSLAVVGNMLPVPFLLLFLESLAKGIGRIESGKKLVEWVFKHTRQRSRVIEKYEKIGLALFVAIPLPLTGAWTGSIAAFLLGLKFSYAFLSILSGVIIAGAIVTSLCLLGWIGAIIAGIGLSILAVIGLWKM